MVFSEIDCDYLNNLIYQINRISDRDKMRDFFMRTLQSVIPSQCAVFCLADGESRFSEPMIRGARAIAAKTAKRDLEDSIAALRWVFDSGLNRVFRLSDYFDKKEAVFSGDFLRECRERDLSYFTLAVFSHEYRCEGCLILMRDYESGDFTDGEIRMLEILKDHLALRLAEERRFLKERRLQWRELRRETIAAIKDEKGLTRREAEVLELIFSGEQNDAICSKLSIAESTLKKHILSVYEKTGSKNRTSLMRLFNETISRGEPKAAPKEDPHGTV